MRAATSDQALHLFRPADDPVMPWPGLLTGVLIIGFYFWCTNQFVIQRALGARSVADGRRGALFAGLLKLPNLFLLILPGAMATLAVGIPVGVLAWIANEILGWLAIQYLYASGILFATNVLLFAAVSLVTAPPGAEQVRRGTWSAGAGHAAGEGKRRQGWCREDRCL